MRLTGGSVAVLVSEVHLRAFRLRKRKPWKLLSWLNFSGVQFMVSGRSTQAWCRDGSCETGRRMDLFGVNSSPGVLGSPGLMWISVSCCFQVLNAQCADSSTKTHLRTHKKTDLKCRRNSFKATVVEKCAASQQRRGCTHCHRGQGVPCCP